MKALLCTAFGPLEQLTVQEVAAPRPGPHQVLIDIKAAALNFPDALMVQGLYQVKPPLPFVPGAEFAGIVAEVGAEVRNCKVGDQVIAYGLGGFAEQAVADATRIMLLPQGMDFDSGAGFVLTYCTSLHGLRDCGRLQAGETLLVLGAAGGVGVAAIEIGKALGARVIAAASSEAKLALCKQLGADAVINYASENLRERIDDITGKQGVDVVYDPVGGAYTEPAIRSLAWGGRLLVVGFAAGDIPKIAINHLLLKERSLIGVYWGESVKHHPRQHLDNVKQLLEWFAAGKVTPHISERVPLVGATAAMARLAGRQVMGKVIVLPQA
ncbi:MAG: NADPH:quinone oxidoreductase family protein [Betaproteobacteria bacterium]|nr:NADPH:quinone oxidoreductase family protein [Betaproteobacteria bacterium]